MKPPIYKVGYKKPPLHSQFKPDESGNKKGRKKVRPATFSDLIVEELEQFHTIDKKGVPIRISGKVLFVKQLIKLAARGQPAAIKTVMELLIDGQARKDKAEREAARAKLPPLDLSNMTDDELTKLYFDTLNKADGK